MTSDRPPPPVVEFIDIGDGLGHLRSTPAIRYRTRMPKPKKRNKPKNRNVGSRMTLDLVSQPEHGPRLEAGMTVLPSEDDAS